MFWLGTFEYESKKELLDRLKDYSNASGGEQKNWCRHFLMCSASWILIMMRASQS